jgi:hypothetical protein
MAAGEGGGCDEACHHLDAGAQVADLRQASNQAAKQCKRHDVEGTTVDGNKCEAMVRNLLSYGGIWRILGWRSRH